MGLLTMYWMSRLLICGLVEKLISTIPSTSRFFDARAVEAEDIRTATEVLMIVQHVFTGLVDVDSDTKRIKQLQLLSVLQMAFGAWYRMEKRAKTSMDKEDEEHAREMQRASTMKKLSLDLGNQLLSCMRLPLMKMVEVEIVSEMFSGGDLVHCNIPEAQVLESNR